MSENEIRIRVGIVADASASSVMTPIEQSVRRTRRVIDAEMRAAAKSIAGEMTKGTTSAERSWQKLELELEREANRMLAAQERAQRQATREFERGERQKTAAARREAAQRARIEKEAAREIERERKASEKAVPFYAQDLGKMLGRGGAIGIGRRAGIRVGTGIAVGFGLAGAALSTAAGIGRDFLGGIGVDTELSSLVSKGVDQQSLATKISNAAYVPGTELVSPSTILSEARATGNETGTDTTEVLKALQDFVGKTGDLQTARDTIGDMAKLSRATGTELSDMANAAAEVTNNLGDVPNKAALTKQIMQQISGQGKLGAVEIRDLASQMAKLAATSSKFKGGAAANIATFGVIAQESKLHGGSATATQAATSVMALASSLTTGSTVKHWKAMGLTPFTDKGQTMLSDPKALIVAALKRTGGNLQQLGTLFGGRQAMRAVSGFASIYSEAGGGDKGVKAVEDEFERLTKAQLDNEEVQRAFAASMQTTEAQVTVFNNKMAAVVESLAGNVLPAFEKLAPEVADFAGSLANLVAEATGANQAKADEDAASAAGKGAKDLDLLNGTAGEANAADVGIEGAGNKKVKVYSQEQLDVMNRHGAARGKAMAELQQEAKTRAEQADEAESATAWYNIGGRIANAGRKALGMESYEDKATRLRQESASDTQKFDELNTEQRETNKVLRDVYLAIKEGNAIARRSTSAPALGGAGRDSGVADVEQDGGH